MSALKTFEKDPSDTLDYQVNWTAWLGADTISSSAWYINGVAAAGVIAPSVIQASPSPSNTTTITTIWLSGGTAPTDYMVTNRIVTTGGRTKERSILIQVRDL